MNPTKYEIYHEEKRHTSLEFPYNTYLCSIPMDFRVVHTHWHEEVEIIVIKKGAGLVSVDLAEYQVQEGDVVFVMSGQLHEIRQLGQNTMEYENILFKPSMLRNSGYDLCWDSFLSPLFSGAATIPAVIDAGSPVHGAITAAIAQIDELCDKTPVGYQTAVKGHLFLLLYQLVTICQHTTEKKRRKQLDKIKVVLRYVEKHYAEPITIEDMAGLCYFSKSHFMKFFKENMGTGFIVYLNDFRLDMAGKMLLTEDRNILDIAAACGYENLSYFNRCFKRKYGVTPGAYRKTMA